MTTYIKHITVARFFFFKNELLRFDLLRIICLCKQEIASPTSCLSIRVD